MLWIRKKPFWILDNEIVELYESRVKSYLTQDLIRNRPFIFHIRYYWNENIKFYIINPETISSWKPTITDAYKSSPHNVRHVIRSLLADALRYLFSQNTRNRKIDLLNLICCPTCGSGELIRGPQSLQCVTCKAFYQIKNNVPIMYPNQSQSLDS